MCNRSRGWNLGWLVHTENSDELPSFRDQEKEGFRVKLLTNTIRMCGQNLCAVGCLGTILNWARLTLLPLNALDKCGSALASADASVDVETSDEMGEEEGGGGSERVRGEEPAR